LQDEQSVSTNARTSDHNDEGHTSIRGGDSRRYDAAFRMTKHTNTARRLKRGQQDGDVPKTAPIIALAAYYSTILHGLALRSRDGASRVTLTQVVDFAMANWQGSVVHQLPE
jgi:hypothetical protein